MPPPEPFRIVIAGAGVAGCILAQGLMHQPGLDVICLEQVGPDDHAEAGTGLNIGPNAIKALAQLDPGLAGDLLANVLPWRHWRVDLTDGTPLMDLPLDRVADNPGIRIRWSELYRFLRTRARDAIHHHRRILSARPAWGREPGPLIVETENADGVL